MSCDAESKALWEDLRNHHQPLLGKEGSDERVCCRVMKQHIARGIDSLISYDAEHQPICVHRLNHCPQCGKKLT